MPHGDNHDLWIAPNDPNRMIEANDGGGNVSVNGGETWTRGDDADRAVLPRDHDQARAVSRLRRAAGQQHRLRLEPAAQAGFGGSGGVDQVFYSVGGGESGYIASDPRNPDIFYAGSYGGLITRLDRRTGQERAINPYPDNPMGYASADIAERFQWTFPIVLAPTDPEHALRRLAARLEVDQRRPELDADQPRPHAPRSEDDGRLRRPDHEGPHRRRDLRDDLHDRAVAEGRERHLDRLRRRLRAGDARRRHDVEERHAEGPRRVRAHQPDRGVAVPRRHRLRRGEPLPAGRLQAVRLPHRRLRRDLDDDHERHRAERFRARDSRGHQARRSCCIAAPSTASTSRSTTARTGSRCGRTCPTRRCTTSRWRSATWSSARTAAAST